MNFVILGLFFSISVWAQDVDLSLPQKVFIVHDDHIVTPQLTPVRPLKKKSIRKMASFQVHSAMRSNRMRNTFGVDLSYMDPIGGVFGAGISYHPIDFLKLNLGYGFTPLILANIHAYGGGARFYVPGWSLSPSIGVSFQNLTVAVNGSALSQITSGLSSIGGTTAVSSSTMSLSALIVSVPMSLDWQAASGFHAEVGYNLIVGGSVPGTSTLYSFTGGAAYLKLGWFFGGASERSSHLDW